MSSPAEQTDTADLFTSARWYDRSVNWAARLDREIPFLREVFGRPGTGGLLDAGCGTGRQAVALAQAGYQVTGADASDEMLELAGAHAVEADAAVSFVRCRYGDLTQRFQSNFDGVYCLGNSLAAAGSAAVAREAIGAFADVLRPGGVLFLQVLNFPAMRRRSPAIMGPRAVTVDGQEYVSVRVFQFVPDPETGPAGRAVVTNVTLFNDGRWRERSASADLYPMEPDELQGWCRAAGLEVAATYGGYDRSALDLEDSSDLLLVARKPK
ncbi:MAG: methyltransferase domain-containing protein [Planctomycetes bacterium]|nr:methyltransferase domain-containing protein [Planctomycetota bacterium]